MITAYKIGKKIIILDKEAANNLYFRHFYGKFHAIPKPKIPNIKRELELSPFDALYLMEKNIIKVLDEENKPLSIEDLEREFVKEYENFKEVYKVYKDFRDKGYIVKSGMKFGSTFTIYKLGPGLDHAPFLVHVLPYNEKLDPIEIIRAGRLSHSVRKKFVIAFVDPEKEKSQYYIFKWLM